MTILSFWPNCPRKSHFQHVARYAAGAEPCALSKSRLILPEWQLRFWIIRLSETPRPSLSLEFPQTENAMVSEPTFQHVYQLVVAARVSWQQEKSWVCQIT